MIASALGTIGEGGVRIRSVERRPSPYQSSSALDEVDVQFEDGSTMALVAKAIDWEAMNADAHRAKPRWLWDHQRERVVYESLLLISDVTVARYFGSFLDDSGIRYLLLERIAGIPLWQSGDSDAWCGAARWLARIHARTTLDVVVRSGAAAHLLRYDRVFYDTWMERALAFHGASSPGVRSLLQPYRKIVDALLGEPQAFLHGEFYSSNVLIEPATGDSVVVRPVDWEMAALGPPSIDLACLLAGRWSDDQRADVADAYYSERAALGASVPARDRYLRALDYSLIHLSVRNLGWSIEWTPPPDRATDWLGEALRLCAKWDL